MISFFKYYLLLTGFEYLYLKFNSVFDLLAQARFWNISLNSLQNLQFKMKLYKNVIIHTAEIDKVMFSKTVYFY